MDSAGHCNGGRCILKVDFLLESAESVIIVGEPVWVLYLERGDDSGFGVDAGEYPGWGLSGDFVTVCVILRGSPWNFGAGAQKMGMMPLPEYQKVDDMSIC